MLNVLSISGLNHLAQPESPNLMVQPFNLQVLDQVAEEKSLIIAVGYMLRSSPAVVAAKRLMQEVRARLETSHS